MDRATRPFVQVVIDGVDAVVLDEDGAYDADLYDRHETFEHARDAALSCIEDILDAGDHDGEHHKAELEAMHAVLDAAGSYDDLLRRTDYRNLLARLEPVGQVAA